MVAYLASRWGVGVAHDRKRFDSTIRKFGVLLPLPNFRWGPNVLFTMLVGGINRVSFGG